MSYVHISAVASTSSQTETWKQQQQSTLGKTVVGVGNKKTGKLKIPVHTLVDLFHLTHNYEKLLIVNTFKHAICNRCPCLQSLQSIITPAQTDHKLTRFIFKRAMRLRILKCAAAIQQQYHKGDKQVNDWHLHCILDNHHHCLPSPLQETEQVRDVGVQQVTDLSIYLKRNRLHGLCGPNRRLYSWHKQPEKDKKRSGGFRSIKTNCNWICMLLCF